MFNDYRKPTKFVKYIFNVASRVDPQANGGVKKFFTKWETSVNW